MTRPLSHPLPAPSGSGDWMQDRLTEARGILADATQHKDTLVILACRTVLGLTDDAAECEDALELWRLLDRRPLHAIAEVSAKGGAA